MSFIYKSAKDFSKAINSFVNEVRVDALGNVIAHKRGVGKRIMLVAHHDVVRLMVSHIDDNGFLYVKPAGSIDSQILHARKVIIKHEENTIIGVIGKKPIHLIREEQNVKVTYDNLWIDIGARSQLEALQMVSKGDYAYFCSDLEELPNKFITGSYLDNQVGLNVLLELAEQLHGTEIPWDVFFVASNHEEIGMRGASVVAHSINPDVCICIDVTHATDYPTTNIIIDGEIKLGKGCVIAKGPNTYSTLFKGMEETAIKHNIMYQVEVSPYPTGTDANVIQLSGEGVKTAVVSIPCRYMHTPHELCSEDDIESAIRIICEFMRNEYTLSSLIDDSI
jgi:endoglucanase